VPEPRRDDHLRDVEDFHEKFKIGYAGPPRFPDRDLKVFRLKFLAEELQELGDALGLDVKVFIEHREAHAQLRDHRQRLVHALDALLDLEYVLLGTVSLLGLSAAWGPGWDRVHGANLLKVRGVKPDRKFSDHRWDVTKPPGWVAPDLRDLVRLP